VVTNIEELHSAMDAEDSEMRLRRTHPREEEKKADSDDGADPADDEDEELDDEPPSMTSNLMKRFEGVAKDPKSDDDSVQMKKEDLSDDEEEEDDDDDIDRLMDDVKNADRAVITRHGYRLSLQRFIVFLHSMQGKKKNGQKFKVLHEALLADLNKEKGKGSMKRLREVAMAHLIKAGPDYLPIDLARLEPEAFLSFLLSITNVKANEFNKSYNGHRSALTFLFTVCEVAPTPSFHAKMKRCMTGLKNTSAAARGEKGSKLGEGKEPMPFEVYRALCKWMLEDGSSEMIFGHCFLTTTWNLMCRSRNTVFVRLEHMGWQNDAMTIQFAHTKTDREGKDAGFKRHVYANPDEPVVCNILSVARYRMAFPGIEEGRLFPGKSQYDRFRKLLGRIVQEHADEIRRLGIDPANIGVHSIRKGAATYCCNGTTAGVQFTAVCVRAGWTMGNVQDRYLQHQAAGDQVCGRTVAGLDVNSERFSLSPPHFVINEASGDGVSGVDGCKANDVDEAIDTVFGAVPQTWRMLSWFLLASLVFHRGWLEETTKEGSRLRGSILFRRGLFDTILPFAHTCLPWQNKNNDVLWRVVFTGITPAVTNFGYHRQEMEMMKDMPGQVADVVENMLDQREMGGGELTMSRLREELFDPFETRIQARLDKHGVSGSRLAMAKEKVVESSFKWDQGQFRSVPKDYEINTKLSCFDAWVTWHLGEDKKVGKSAVEYSTPPWKTLKVGDLKRTGSQKTYLANLKVLCETLDRAAELTKVSRPSLVELRSLYKSAPIQNVLKSVGTTKTGRQRRVDQIRWESLARQLRKPKAGTQAAAKTSRTQAAANKTSTPKLAKTAARRKARQAPKKKRKAVELDSESEDEVKFTGTGHRMSPSKAAKERIENRKAKRRAISKKAGKCNVPGPIPSSPDDGFLTLNAQDLKQIDSQGVMLSGASTTAYLNLLTRQHYHLGVRRSVDTFFPNLRSMLREHGLKHGSCGTWIKFADEVKDARLGDHGIDWTNDNLIFIQVFRGPTEAGHWALLVVDRTVDKLGRLVFIDSLPNLYKDTFEQLRECLSGTPLTPDGCKWIRASMPRQGPRTMDCGVFMSCIAAAYTKGVVSRGCFSAQEVSDFTSVSIQFKDDATILGGEGRDHMLASVRLQHCNLDAAIFDRISIQWLTNV
jgi:hypothetical protein